MTAIKEPATPEPALTGPRPYADLSFAGIRIEREPWIDLETRQTHHTTPRLILCLSTKSGLLREVELDRYDAARLLGELAAANLSLVTEEVGT